MKKKFNKFITYTFIVKLIGYFKYRSAFIKGIDNSKLMKIFLLNFSRKSILLFCKWESGLVNILFWLLWIFKNENKLLFTIKALTRGDFLVYRLFFPMETS